MARARAVRILGVGMAAVLACTACSLLPYPTATPKALQREMKPYLDAGGGPKPGEPWALSLCYSEAFNTPKEVLAEARFLCPKGEVTYRGTDVIWTPCSLMQPSRASFICTPRQAAGSETPAVQ